MLFGKNYDNAFSFSKVIRQNIVVSFPRVVRDNVVSNDVTITSSLRILCTVIKLNRRMTYNYS